MSTQDQYWMVLGSGTPRYRHATEQSARTEAARLARNNPGVEFVVLRSVCTVQLNKLSITEHDLPAWLKLDAPSPAIITLPNDPTPERCTCGREKHACQNNDEAMPF